MNGTFCWLDLAASDAGRAQRFYAQAFGWHFHERAANGGRFTLCRAGERDIASMYPLRRAQLEAGMPSHWTPYVAVPDLQAAASRVTASGGRIVVAPFDVEGMARIALVEDAVGALLGLWQSP
jgi:predicted enzyme related to lactoylglutathione lyase